MMLAIDIGNTNGVFAILGDNGEPKYLWRTATRHDTTPEDMWVWLSQMLSWGKIEIRDIKEVVIGTVVPSLLFCLKNMSRTYLNCDPIIASANELMQLNVKIDIDTPNEAGIDLLLNTISVWKKWHKPALIIDFGTATTINVVGVNGSYKGCVIMPGVNLSIDALSSRTAKLPRISFSKTKKVIGKSTVHSMQSGIFWGYISMIKGMIQFMKDEFKQEENAVPIIVATGGLSAIFKDWIEEFDIVDEHLTLYGLYVYESLRKNKIKY